MAPIDFYDDFWKYYELLEATLTHLKTKCTLKITFDKKRYAKFGV